MNLQEQIEYAIKIFEPYKERILGCIDGNHEQRLVDDNGFSPLSTVAGMLGFPYFRSSVVYRLVVGKGKAKRHNVQGTISYTGYFHHTTGGGTTVGGKMNRVARLRQLICNCDFYCGSHNHQLGVVPVETRFVDSVHRKIQKVRQLLIDTGSYLEWDDGYAEMKQLEPSKMGSPRIRLDGTRRDCHVSV
jgi:hypothetical protein